MGVTGLSGPDYPEEEIRRPDHRQAKRDEPIAVLNGQLPHRPFQRFITSEPLQSNYNLDSGPVEKLKAGQVEVIVFSHKFLKQVLFGKKMFDEKEGAEEACVKRMKEKTELVKKAAERSAKDFARKQMGGKT